MSAPTMEYLGSARADHRRHALLIAGPILLIALLVAGFLWWSDQVRQDTNEELAAVFAESSARAESGERQVQGTLAYASPLIWSADVSEDVRAGLRGLVEASAADVAADLGALRERIAGATVLPWQEPQAEAQRQLVALIGEQQARFAGIARDAGDIDLILAGGPLQTGVVVDALRASGADATASR